MTIPAKYQYIAASVLIVVAFATGRYTKHNAVSTTSNITDNKNENKQTHTVTTTVVSKTPQGATQITKTQDTVVTDVLQDVKHDQESVKVVSSPKVNISALVSPGFQDGLKMSYGISVNKEILGPVTVGAFGLTNGVIGLSVGLNF